MITTTYILVITTLVLLMAAGVVAFRSRIGAIGLIAAAVATGATSAVCGYMALEDGVSPAAYKAVEKAAAEDPEVDAAAQWALEDNRITPSEFGQIAEVYSDKTGRDLKDLVQKEK